MTVADQCWGFIVQQAKPSRALAAVEIRPALTQAHIRHEGERTYLYASDAYILVKLPIRFEGGTEERDSLLPEVALPREAVGALDAGSGFRVRDGFLELNSCEARYPVSSDSSMNFETILHGPLQRLQNGDKQPVDPLVFDPALLHRAYEALGGFAGRGVVCEPIAPQRPMGIRLLGDESDWDKGFALVMPIKWEARA